MKPFQLIERSRLVILFAVLFALSVGVETCQEQPDPVYPSCSTDSECMAIDPYYEGYTA